MPPRPPPSPPVLTFLCCLAAVAASWLSVAVDALVRAGVGAVAGVPSAGLALVPDAGWTLSANQTAAAAGPFVWTLVIVAGSVAVLIVSGIAARIVSFFRMAGWIRALALVWSLVGLIWIPTALVCAVLTRRGRGPVEELYERLGDPQTGRWSAAALGVVMLVIVAGMASRGALDGARGWMRADGLEFRRRLVRAVGGWPAAISVVVLGLGAGWAKTPWLAAWAVAVMLAFQLRTR